MGSRIRYYFVVALLALGCEISYCAEYLTEKPDFLHTCERKDENLSKCLALVFQNMYTTWKNGVPGTTYQGSIDPLQQDKLEIGDDLKNIAPIDFKVSNYTATGLNATIVDQVILNEKNYNFKLYGSTDKTAFDGYYSIKGQLLQLHLDAKGKIHFDIYDNNFTIAAKVSVQERDNVKFFLLKAVKYKITSTGNVKLHFDNLFADKQLNDDANELFNTFWHDLFDIFEPVVQKEITKHIYRHLQGIFNVVPAKYIIADVDKSD